LDIIEYNTLLRLSEQYLIRAEARNELSKLSDAVEDINVLRSRSRAPASLEVSQPLPPLDASLLDREQVKAAIMKERQVELFTEQGNRWFDLKRTNSVDHVMSIVAPLKEGGGANWSGYKKIWPLPETEILKNKNLSQNQGYN
jgi:hypothetical protein